jgi:cell migration-inducing and hyaluronan-binding protein
MQGNAKWANDNGNSQAWKTAVIRDKDGSLGDGPNAYILINDGVNDSIATDAQACEIKPTWNAAVCKGDVGRLAFAAPPNLGPRPPGPGPGGPGGPGPGGPGPGAAPAAAAPGTPGAAGPGAPPPRVGGPPPPQPPVILSRNGRDYPIVVGGSNVRAGTEIKVTTERPSLPLRLTELDKGSWVIFQLPGFNTAASGTQQNSLDALRKASETSYFKDKDALWVKLVSADNGELGLGGATTLQVSR